MYKFFPVIKQVNMRNITTSIAVVSALCSQVMVMKTDVKSALTIFVLVLFLNRIADKMIGYPGYDTEFGKELESLAELLNFIITPIVISYYMGFRSLYSCLFFALYLLAGIWRLSDINQSSPVQKNGKTNYSGLCCAHTGAIFLIAASVCTRFNYLNNIFIFIPFFIIASGLMISSFSYNKNGKMALLLYLLTPVSIIMIWF